MLVAADIDKVARRAPLPATADTSESLRCGSEGRRHYRVGRSGFAAGLQVGQVLEIPSPSGTLRLPIVSIRIDYSDQQGSILMDRALYRSGGYAI